MIVSYGRNKRKNLIVFLDPTVSVSRKGNIIFEKDCNCNEAISIKMIRHLISTKIQTLGYLDTMYVNGERIGQSFFPMSGVKAIGIRKTQKEMRYGQVFDQLYKRSIDDAI